MGNLIGNILNFLTSPIGFVIIFGLIGGLGKLANWFQQERARRAAIHARARRQTEELRMGRPVDLATQPTAVQAPVQTQPQTAADRQRALQEQRAAQLRALQQQRLAELRAKRAQAAGGVATPAPSRTPTPPPARTAQRPKPPQPAREAPAPLPSARPPRPAPSRPVPTMSPGAFTQAVVEPVAPSMPAVQPGPTPAPAARSGLGALLGTQADLRRAVILSEVLGPPVCDRNPDQSGVF